MNKLFLTAVFFLLASRVSYAQFPDGSEVLEQEKKRINELNELEHQVKIMEQKTKIIKAQQEIEKYQEKNIFLNLESKKSRIPPSDKYREHSKSDDYYDHQLLNNDNVEKLPTLISIDGNGFAGFKTRYGSILAKKGDIIPGNFRVDQISIDYGVIVSKSGRRYNLDMSW